MVPQNVELSRAEIRILRLISDRGTAQISALEHESRLSPGHLEFAITRLENCGALLRTKDILGSNNLVHITQTGREFIFKAPQS